MKTLNFNFNFLFIIFCIYTLIIDKLFYCFALLLYLKREYSKVQTSLSCFNYSKKCVKFVLASIGHIRNFTVSNGNCYKTFIACLKIKVSSFYRSSKINIEKPAKKRRKSFRTSIYFSLNENLKIKGFKIYNRNKAGKQD